MQRQQQQSQQQMHTRLNLLQQQRLLQQQQQQQLLQSHHLQRSPLQLQQHQNELQQLHQHTTSNLQSTGGCCLLPLKPCYLHLPHSCTFSQSFHWPFAIVQKNEIGGFLWPWWGWVLASTFLSLFLVCFLFSLILKQLRQSSQLVNQAFALADWCSICIINAIGLQ